MTRYPAIIATAILLTAATAYADTSVEKCKVVKDGKGLIKTGKGNCASGTHSCAAQNKLGDPESWIAVPKGMCDQINAGNFKDVPVDIKEKIEGAQ